MNDPYKTPDANLNIETTAQNSGGELDLASKWMRFWGALIDSVLVGGPSVAIAFYFGFYDNLTTGAGLPLVTQLLMLVIGISIMLLINGYLIYKRGQTVGKLICGTRVVTLDGKQVSGNTYVFLRLAPMWIASQIPVVGGFVGLIDSLLIFRKDRNCLHDDIAKTRVVNA